MNLEQLRGLFRGENAEKIKSMLEELDSVDEQIRSLSAKRRQLDSDLSALIGVPRKESRQSAAGRRSGVREQVLDTIKSGSGMGPNDIRAALNIANGDKRGSQSVANAISALKRDGQIKEDGHRKYVAA